MSLKLHRIEEHLNQLSQTLQILINADLKCSVSKSFFCFNKIRSLGVDITEQGLAIPDSVNRTLKKLKEMKMKNKKDVQKFLGYIIFWKNFIKNLSSRTYHLRQLTHDDTKFKFTSECQAEREDVISELQNAPTLQAVNPYGPIFLVVDSSCKGVGCSVMQHKQFNPTRAEINSENRGSQEGRTKLVPIMHLSYTISKSIQQYPSTQLELYGISKSIQTLSNLHKSKEIHCFSDNIGFSSLLNLKIGNSRQKRMLAFLQNYDITMASPTRQ
jgi:RNase H-like domain found in reverse transcriptase